MKTGDCKNNFSSQAGNARKGARKSRIAGHKNYERGPRSLGVQRHGHIPGGTRRERSGSKGLRRSNSEVIVQDILS